ncbi:hypothetical protein OAH18_01170 [bacterium]|nr:hypothetical protein [bacterium]
MDEEAYLAQIQSSPGNLVLLQQYASWLAECDDIRGEYLETEIAFRQAEARVEELRRTIYDLTVVRGLEMSWLDVVHPLYVTAIAGGTFCVGPAEGAPSCVRVGDACNPQTVIGTLEIGSVYNKIAAGCAGYVSEFIVADGQAVNRGDILLKLSRLPPAAVGEAE